jgi:hypothetical protein
MQQKAVWFIERPPAVQAAEVRIPAETCLTRDALLKDELWSSASIIMLDLWREIQNVITGGF